MKAKSVEAVWVWRYGTAPFKATYGRLPGAGSTTYTKDFLQASGDCAEALDQVFSRKQEVPFDLTLVWPGGSRNGKILEAADYSSNGRLNLRWDTNNAPDPWRLHPNPESTSVATFPGDPTRTTEQDADLELGKLTALDAEPWLVAVKLHGEADTLHVRAYMGSPPVGLEYTTTEQLPSAIRAAMDQVPLNGGCATVCFGTGIRAPKIVSGVLGALTRGPNVLLIGPPGSGKTIALEDLRNLFERGSLAAFDASKLHDAWSSWEAPDFGSHSKVRTVVFHPSYSYEEFVIGLYPVPAMSGGVHLKLRPGPLPALAHWAAEVGNRSLLLVDEFNRGNASAIFGDTLALLDKDNRCDEAKGQPGTMIDRSYSELELKVPEDFATTAGDSIGSTLRLPLSLNIVAAMNSSDRSVAPLDAALRRRFSIVRVDPDYDILAAQLGITTSMVFSPIQSLESCTVDDVSCLAITILRTLNKRIELVLGSDFLLGHSLFWDVNRSSVQEAFESLCSAFDERVIGTLRMTFVDQDESLSAILNGPPPPVEVSPAVIAPVSGVVRWVRPTVELTAVASDRLQILSTREMTLSDAAAALQSLL